MKEVVAELPESLVRNSWPAVLLPYAKKPVSEGQHDYVAVALAGAAQEVKLVDPLRVGTRPWRSLVQLAADRPYRIAWAR
jgi:hypothetical protein